MMLRIKSWFTKEAEVIEEVSLEQATAMLLFEAATADYQLDDSEREVLLSAMQQGLKIDAGQAETLLAWAENHSPEATSLYPFTSLINKSLSPEEKTLLLTNIWRVAYADGRIDKYEELYLRKIADLMHLPHSLFIAAKLKAMPKD